MRDPEKRKASVRAWQLANPEKVKEAKRKYRATAKGKAQKKKEDAAYAASGGRAVVEAKRSLVPVSTARKAARARWALANVAYFTAVRLRRRSLVKQLSSEDFWVLQEAVKLARLREKVVGGKWHVDHVIPVSKGGMSTPDNIQVVPAAWNRRKSNVHTERFFGALQGVVNA